MHDVRMAALFLSVVCELLFAGVFVCGVVAQRSLKNVFNNIAGRFCVAGVMLFGGLAALFGWLTR